MSSDLTPGLIVHNPRHPEWGLGQVQSVIGTRATVNFEHMGKMTIHIHVVALEPVADDPAGARAGRGSGHE